MKASITSGNRTDDQTRAVKQLAESAASQGVELALKRFNPDAETTQNRLIKRGDRLKQVIIDAVITATQQALSSELLKPVGSVTIPAIGVVRAKDNFKVDRNAPVPIGWIGSNFEQHFLSGEGKIEEAVAEATLEISELLKSSVDGPIIAELGGEQIVETTLGQMYKMMEKQAHGEEGDLLVNGYANIFYIRDQKGRLWAVGCRWRSGRRYWFVEAYSVAVPAAWDAGCRVVSS